MEQKPSLTYSQGTGIIRDSGDVFVAMGWAGHGEGKNNPALQGARSLGPLPQGLYKVGPWHDHPRLGPMVCELIQVSGETYGRSEFFIHGPASVASGHQGQESKGCIVVFRTGRTRVKGLLPEGSLLWVRA